MTLLEPPGISPEDLEDDDVDTLDNAYIPDPDEVFKKYTDPARLTEVIIYLEEKVFATGTELATIKSTLIDLKNHLNKVHVALKEIMPEEKPFQSEDATLNVVERSGWGALKMKNLTNMRILQHPITKVNFTFSTNTESCSDPETCAKLIKKIQIRDMKSGLPDIAHNFLVSEDGNVYEGRGWHLAPAIADTDPKYEKNTIDIAFAGNYQSDIYPFELFETAIDLVNSGVEQKFVSADYNML